MGWQVWPKRIFLGMLLAFIFLALTACSDKWYGTGTVVDKSFRDSYTTIVMSGKVPVPITNPSCWRLKVVEHNGKEHEGCVSSRVWDDAMLGHQITLTEQYH
jgi:hypothetical protein